MRMFVSHRQTASGSAFGRPRRRGWGLVLAAAMAACAAVPAVQAQEAVEPARVAEHLFTSPNPRLHANKQVAYHIIRDLLESGHWEDMASQYLTERYIQHNPNAASGRDNVVNFFVNVLGVKPQPIPKRMATPIVNVIAEGDLVTVIYPRLITDPNDPSRSYTTTWYDTWRIKGGKADEHWDPALRGENVVLGTLPK